MKIEKILVPTDFSEEANNALEVAVGMARTSGASISLLHVLDVPVVGHYDSLDIMSPHDEGDEASVYKHYMMQLMKVTKHKFDEIKEKYEGVSIQEHVVFDSLAKHIDDFIAKNDTDLIVIGSKGASGLEEILVGSNTERVIRRVKAPVLTVKHHEEGYQPKDIVFASNFMNVSEKAVASLKSFQNVFEAKLHFVKIITPNTFETTSDTHGSIKKFAEYFDFKNFTVNSYNYYSEEEGIRAFAESIDADLIALTTHGRTGIAHLLLGSIAEEVANHSVTPVLTFNEHFK